MKNNIFMLFCALVIAAILIVAATLMHLSKTSEYSRTSDQASEVPSESGSGSADQ